MNLNTLSDLKISFIIPRRGKGSSEVISSISISSNGTDLLENLIKYFIEYQKKVLDREVLLEMVNNIVTELQLNELSINISFSLPIDRLSPDLEESVTFILDCEYFVNYNKGKIETFMVIKCPVRINYIFVMKGEVKLKVLIPQKNVYFEDLLDIIQKYGNTIIYPISEYSDKKILQKKIDKGKTVEEYLRSIKKAIKTGAINRDLSEKGYLSVSFYDVYNMYKIEKGVIW